MRRRFFSKILCFFLTAILCLFSLTGCGSDTNAASTGTSSSTSLRLFNCDPEISGVLQALADRYKTESCVTVTIENCPSGADPQTILKQYYLSNDLPDIISGDAYVIANWKTLLTDLSDQSWCSDTGYAYIDKTYGTLGFPYSLEAAGIVYNASILKKAGLEPEFIKDTESFTTALFIMYSLRDSLGLSSVVGYCAEKSYLSTSRGTQIFGQYLDAGQSRSDSTYYDLLSTDSPIDHDRAFDFAFYLSLMQHFSDQELLTKGDYNAQLQGFAEGKYAFIPQTSRAGNAIKKNFSKEYRSSGSFEMGYIPFTFQSGLDTLLVDSPAWWAIPKSGNTEAAKNFLQWCSGGSAQKLLVEEKGFISPFNSCRYSSSNPLSASVEAFEAASKTSRWNWMKLSPGIRVRSIAPVFNDYAKGKLGIEEFVTDLTEAIRKY
ncbi:MAG: ABC transporter substrate-binding protein [Lachnospiraceae bacterium]|nr:ABC transporter substrate-binding protein [Lachnospiraceae bacterium]